MAGKDPVNIVVCGVGGQGNVLLSRLIAKAFVNKGYHCTISETFGGSQRGGSVMSHVRASHLEAPGVLIPRGKADVVVGIEPMETLRILATYGNPSVAVISNTRPVYPMSCIMGEKEYPDLASIKAAIRTLSGRAWFLDATEMSMEIGDTLLTNIIMIGALVATETIDLTFHEMEGILREQFAGKVADKNLAALQRGRVALEQAIA